MTDPTNPHTETTLDLSQPTARQGKGAAAAAAALAASAEGGGEGHAPPVDGELVGGRLVDPETPGDLGIGPKDEPIVEHEITNGMGAAALPTAVLKAVAEAHGTSLDTLHDQDDDPKKADAQTRLRLAVEEVTGAIVRMARRFHNARSDAAKPSISRLTVFAIPKRGKVAAWLEHESGERSSVLIVDAPSSGYEPPAPAPVEAPTDDESAAAPPASPPAAPASPNLAPPVPGLAKPGFFRRGAPQGPPRR